MSGKYEKKGNKPKRKWVKILLIFCLVVIALIGAIFAFLWSKLDMIQFDNEVDYSAYEETLPQQQRTHTQ